MTSTQFATSFRNLCFDAIFPPRCAGGTEASRDCEKWSRDLFCAACAQTLQTLESNIDEMPLCNCCGASMKSANAATLCADCRDNRYHQSPPFDAARSVYGYGGAIRPAIHRFKYDGKTALAKPLARLLTDYLRTSSTRSSTRCVAPDEIDLIVPVPLHRFRQWQRGFNQSELLARHIGRELQIPSREVLRRTRFTPPQVQLAREERQKNVQGAFALHDTALRDTALRDTKHDISGATILLIDDVYTTGATLKECAQVLKNAGAKRVFVLTLARSN